MAVPMYALFIIFIIFLVFKLYRRFRFKLPPGPFPLPFVGNLYKIKALKCRCFAEWAKIYGPIFTVYMGSQVNVVITTPKLAKEVLKENDQVLADRYRTRASSMMSRNGKDLIWADYGAHYVKVRKLCNLELFAPKRLEALRPIREDEVTAMVESIFKNCTNRPESRGKSLVLREYLAPVSFNNITRLAFGKRFMNSEGVVDEQGEIMKGIVTNGIKIGAKLSTAEHVPWLRWMFMVENEELIKHNARRDKLTRIIMEEHTLARQKSGNTKHHFVDALLSLQSEYDLSEDTIIGLLWDMITAGMDTTTISVEWAMAELVKNPRVQKKAQEELDNVIGPNRVMQESDLSRLPYLQYITKEALRLHPPTPLMLPHKASADVKIGGYDIPKGSVAHVNVWAIGRDIETWKDPLEFRPERFMEEDVDMKGHDYRLLPFGAGRRVCPGAQLAINLVSSMLGHLLHHFSWSPPEGIESGDIDLTESPGTVTYMASPLQAIATPRLDSNLYKRMPTPDMSI